MGLGMNVMGGDEFKRRHQGSASAHANSSAAASEPKPAPKAKQVRHLEKTCIPAVHAAGKTQTAGCLVLWVCSSCLCRVL